jgi:Zinc binding domain
MNCCATDALIAEPSLEPMLQRCATCKEQGRRVSRKTVLLMLKPHLLEQAFTGTFSFCEASDCPVVYFEEQGSRVFSEDDLRLIVGVKAKTGPIPLCYCFGFDESHVRDEISQRGNTTIPERVSRLIRDGLCACETRNPSGACCLGEVNKAVKRILGRLKESDKSND